MSLQPTTLARLLVAALCASVATALAAPVADAAPARYEGASADGSVVVFTTTDKLVNGDTDSFRDVFERSYDTGVGEYVTRLVSIGPSGGNQARDASYGAVSVDGKRVVFSTQEPLVAADTDGATDVYLRDLEANATELVSRGDGSCSGTCGNGSNNASFVPGGVAAEGKKVFFATTEKLSDDDGDSASDIYMRDIEGDATILVSKGDVSCAASACGDGADPAFFADASADGTKVVLTSEEELAAGDNDGAEDLYQRDLVLEVTRLISTAGTCPSGLDCTPVFGGASSNGSHVFFETKAQIALGDSDESADVYDWSGVAPTLASTGPTGGNGANNVTYAGSSADGESVFFHTDEKLVSADEDSLQDVYERRSGATTVLVSTGPEGDDSSSATFRGVADNAGNPVVFFITAESLLALDTDNQEDVYERTAGETTLVSRGNSSCEPACGNGEDDANFADASSDGSHVLFVTDESLVAKDADAVQDIYERFGGDTTLVSIGPAGGSGAFPTKRLGIAADGSKAFFETSERLTVDDDFANEDDVYARSENETLLVSVGNDPGLIIGPLAPELEGTSPVSPNESTEPLVRGLAAEGTEVKLYKNASCSGEQAEAPGGEPAGGSAAELKDPGIAVTVSSGSTTTFYATAEAEGFVSPCSNGITYKQETPPPPPPPPGPGGGSSGGGTGTGTASGSGSTATSPKGGGTGTVLVTPETRITFGPSFKTRKRKAVFRFLDATGQPGTTFRCKRDRERWRPCSSPMRLKKLGVGKHVFKVQGRNAAGTWEPRPVQRVFKVVR